MPSHPYKGPTARVHAKSTIWLRLLYRVLLLLGAYFRIRGDHLHPASASTYIRCLWNGHCRHLTTHLFPGRPPGPSTGAASATGVVHLPSLSEITERKPGPRPGELAGAGSLPARRGPWRPLGAIWVDPASLWARNLQQHTLRHGKSQTAAYLPDEVGYNRVMLSMPGTISLGGLQKGQVQNVDSQLRHDRNETTGGVGGFLSSGPWKAGGYGR